MSLLTRRRAMMQPKSAEWDIDWDYTMGMPEDNGYSIRVDTATAEMTDDGVHVVVSAGGDKYLQYLPPQVTCNEGIWEIEAKIVRSNTGFGTRIQVSDGTGGGHVMIRSSGSDNELFVSNGKTNSSTGITFSSDAFHLLRLEWLGKMIYFYIDGDLVYSGSDYSTYYCTNTKVFAMEYTGEIYLKSMRYKTIS